jgi:hypothetical protein
MAETLTARATAESDWRSKEQTSAVRCGRGCCLRSGQKTKTNSKRVFELGKPLAKINFIINQL